MQCWDFNATMFHECICINISYRIKLFPTENIIVPLLLYTIITVYQWIELHHHTICWLHDNLHAVASMIHWYINTYLYYNNRIHICMGILLAQLHIDYHLYNAIHVCSALYNSILVPWIIDTFERKAANYRRNDAFVHCMCGRNFSRDFFVIRIDV